MLAGRDKNERTPCPNHTPVTILTISGRVEYLCEDIIVARVSKEGRCDVCDVAGERRAHGTGESCLLDRRRAASLNRENRSVHEIWQSVGAVIATATATTIS